jgi:hypothetical protein
MRDRGDGVDEPGTVRVYVRRIGPDRKVVKGNISRTLEVADASVGAVADTIEACLFGTRGR